MKEDYLLNQSTKLVQFFWENSLEEHEYIEKTYTFMKEVCKAYAENELEKYAGVIAEAKKKRKKMDQQTTNALIEGIEDLAINNKKR